MKNHWKKYAGASLLLLLCACGGQTTQTSSQPAYADPAQPIERRVEDALSRMTMEEKVALLHAQSKFSSAGVPRLGIPEVWCSDGPHGIRPEVLWDEWDQAGWTNDSCTAFPALTALAATWNRELAALYGRSIGEEARYRKKDVLLGPGVNIYRLPLNGRNFEYMGEDPCLAAKMVTPYIQGVQKNGVAACVKHYALNNQEVRRTSVNVVVDDRTLHEIYLPAFKAAVQEGGAWAIMGAYNRYRGEFCCHNQRLLNDILKKDWKFDGVVISDWGGTHDTRQAVENGLDMEFGTWTDGLSKGTRNAYDNYHLAYPYLEMLKKGEASVETLNDKARRVLRLIFRTSLSQNRPLGSLNSPEHLAAAREIAREGMVLLKNDNQTLPIDLEKTRRLLVVGENAIKMMTVGGGSSSLKVRHECSPLEGIMAAAGDKTEVVFERGYIGDTGGEYNGVITGQDLEEKRSEEQLIADAVKQAKSSDVILFIGGLNKAPYQDTESCDRVDYALPYAQNRLIEALAETGKPLSVVLVSGNAVSMPWVDKVPAILEAWYSGSEAGNALADLLFGKANPSGKLPFSFYRELSDCAAIAQNAYPGDQDVEYKEGIFVGYRHLDKENIEPLFPFGHGLSYTTFSYGEVKASQQEMKETGSIRLSMTLTNTGTRAGSETVQLYIGDTECSQPRPVKELKDFRKVHLEPGESCTVSFTVTPDMLRFYDPQRGWTLEKGDFKAYIAASSRDIKSTTDFRVL